MDKLPDSICALFGINPTISNPLQRLLYGTIVPAVSYFVVVLLPERLSTALWHENQRYHYGTNHC